MSINFVPRLAQAVPYENQIYLEQGETSSHCPAFGRADTGYLCVYAAWENAVSFTSFLSPISEFPESDGTTAGTGFSLLSSSGQGNARGNWAYTAS